jgi:hypothetical protein
MRPSRAEGRISSERRDASDAMLLTTHLCGSVLSPGEAETDHSVFFVQNGHEGIANVTGDWKRQDEAWLGGWQLCCRYLVRVELNGDRTLQQIGRYH